MKGALLVLSVFLALGQGANSNGQVTLLSIGHTNNNTALRAYATQVLVFGNYACLGNLGDGIRIYDVSNPANPVNIGHNDSVLPNGLALSSNLLYVACGQGLFALSLSNPAAPISIGSTNDATAFSVAVSGSNGFVGTYVYGLRIYDVSNPAQPIRIGETNNGGHGNGVAVYGNYVYLANDSDGLRVYDVSSPSHPINIGHTNDGGAAQGCVLNDSGTLLFLASTGNTVDGLRIFDVSNPANPFLVGQVDEGGLAEDVVVAGHHAFLANYDDGFRIYAVEPQLSITRTNGNSLLFSWPATAPFGLQQNSTFNPANWVTFTNVPLPVGGLDQMTLPVPGGNVIFRLISQ